MNVYKDFVVLHNMTLDPRDVKLFVDWLKCCEKNSAAYLIGEAMEAAMNNYVAGSMGFTHSKNIHEDIYYYNEECDNLEFEGVCRVTNKLCDKCKTIWNEAEQEGTEND